MGILDWFVNRPAQFDPESRSAEMTQRAIDKAVLLTNPRFKILRDYRERLAPAVEKSIEYLQGIVVSLPAPIDVSPRLWGENPSLRAFFAANTDVSKTVGRSKGLNTLFSKYPQLDTAYFVLGMACDEQRQFGMALQGDVVQRDVAQTVLVFSDHQARICGQTEAELRRLIGSQSFEYLVAEVLAQIGGERSERRELEEARSLLRARLRLLQQQGPGLGSLFSGGPEQCAEKDRLERELLDNERQLESTVSPQGVLESEFDNLCEVLANPSQYLAVDIRRPRVNTLNVIVTDDSEPAAATIDYSRFSLFGAIRAERAFVLGRFSRVDLSEQRLDFDLAARAW